MNESVPLKEYIDRLREADQRALDATLAAQARAIEVAEANAEKWRANANEWRAAMTDRERTFFSRGMGYIAMALGIVATMLTILPHLKG